MSKYPVFTGKECTVGIAIFTPISPRNTRVKLHRLPLIRFTRTDSLCYSLPTEGTVRKYIPILVILMLTVACGPTKISQLQKTALKDQTLVLYFSRTVKHNLTVSIDNKNVPIAAPAEGRRLEIHNLKPGNHQLALSSSYYIVSEPIRDIQFTPKEKQVVQLFGLIKYRDQSVGTPTAKRQGFFKTLFSKLLFWKGKTTEEEKKIDTTGIYGEFTD